jgi:hypothetical protein
VEEGKKIDENVHNDLSVERGGFLGGIVLGVSTNVSSSDILD